MSASSEGTCSSYTEGANGFRRKAFCALCAIDHMQILLDDDTTDYKEININGDKAGVLIRRKFVDWVKEEYPELA